jgi:hypothetical protein
MPLKTRRGEANWILIAGIGAAVLAIAIGGFLVFKTLNAGKYIEIGGVKVWKIPGNAVVEFTDLTKAKRIKELYDQNLLLAFDGNANGNLINKTIHYSKAELNGRAEVSKFLSTNVETWEKRVTGMLSNVQSATETTQPIELTADAYKAISQAVSESYASGSSVIARWYVNLGNGNYEFHVVMIYDPVILKSVLELNAQASEAVKELGKQNIDFFSTLNDVLSEASKGTTLEK